MLQFNKNEVVISAHREWLYELRFNIVVLLVVYRTTKCEDCLLFKLYNSYKHFCALLNLFEKAPVQFI